MSRPAGIKARYDGDCPRCDDQIVGGRDRIVIVRDRPIHVGCASGQDDGEDDQ